MRYCRKRKIAVLFPARTGGSSFIQLLMRWGFKEVFTNGKIINELKIRHLFPNEVINYVPDFDTYSKYAFFRNPLTRFVSAYTTLIAVEEPTTTVDRIINHIDFYSQHPWFFKQIDYFNGGTQPLDFDNYENEVKKFGVMLGFEDFVVFKHGKGFHKRSDFTAKVEEFVRFYYADDYKLGKELFGKEY